jgi:EpsI family protein
VALAVALLAASFGVRAWQARGVDQALREGRKSPFPLGDLPLQLGDWEGTPEALDPQIARNTGCTDYVFRTYQNRITGARVGVIVLYGPGEEVYIHSPALCYPAAGYASGSAEVTRTVRAGDAAYPFSTAVYSKGEGSGVERQEVYWAWGIGGRWQTNVAHHKEMERIAGMYKVHLSRLVREGELRDFGNPCELLLAELMPWLDRRIEEAKARAEAGPAA